MTETRARLLSVSDVALLAGGLVGAALLFYLLPRVHPDVVLRSAISRQEAIEAARVFLEEGNQDFEDLEPSAAMRRDESLLVSVQRLLGRNRAVAALNGSEGGLVPAYHWEVLWGRPGANEGRGPDFRVAVSLAGGILGFENRNAVGLFGRADSVAQELTFSLQFDRGVPTTMSLESEPVEEGEARRRSSPPAPGEARRPSAADTLVALSFARYHLGRSGFAALPFDVDSVWVSERRRGPLSVRFASEEPVIGHRAEVDVQATPLGLLVSLEARFEPPDGERATPWWAGGNSYEVASLIVFVALVLVFVFAFFKRAGARSVDLNAALRDAVVLGLFGGLSLFLVTVKSMNIQSDNDLLPLALAALGALFGGLGIGVLVFLVSGATDSAGREVWPWRLRTMSLVRQVQLRNQPVGLAILRGVAASFVLAGGWTAVLGIADSLYLPLGEVVLAEVAAGSAFVARGGSVLWMAFLKLTMVLIGVGAFARRRGARASVIAVVMVGLLVLLAPSPTTVGPGYGELAVSLLFAVALVWLYLRFDFLTALMAFALSGVLCTTGLLWWSDASGLTATGATGVGFLLLALVAGFVGVWAGKSSDEIPEYVPEYIAELARQERIARELEIARQVQASFLPRTMPEAGGLDVAGVCLAANEVGGDYYDLVPLSERRVGVLIGDVSGKGIQAAFYMTLVKGFFRTLCSEIDSPAEVLRRMNRLFWENSDRGTFISLIYGVVDLAEGTFTFSRAGHNPIILKRTTDEPVHIKPAGLALGLVSGGRFDALIEEQRVGIARGDVLVLYTDGFSEAANAMREEYGDHRLAGRVAEFGRYSANTILRRMTDDVQAFIGETGRRDDMTMVVLKITEHYEGPSRPAEQSHA